MEKTADQVKQESLASKVNLDFQVALDSEDFLVLRATGANLDLLELREKTGSLDHLDETANRGKRV